jgi:SAM-dependent methyltransferase
LKEATKASKRRKLNPLYNTIIKGEVLDIGCGDDPINQEQYPNITSVTKYDRLYGHQDAATLPEFFNLSPVYMNEPEVLKQFDTVHSSHCLEHVYDPYFTLKNWLKVTKTGGHIVVTVPDSYLYEQGFWPSKFNLDHKVSFTTSDQKVLLDDINVLEMLQKLQKEIPNEIVICQLIDEKYDYSLNRLNGSMFMVDQTLGDAECAIEFIIKKI